MITLILVTLWLLVGGFFGYWIGYASRADEVRALRRDRYYLRKWCDQQVRATMEADLELELERIRRNV